MLVDPAPRAAGSEAHHQGGSFSSLVPGPPTCLACLSSSLETPLCSLLPLCSPPPLSSWRIARSLDQLCLCPREKLQRRLPVVCRAVRHNPPSRAVPWDPPPSVLPFSQALLKTPSGDSERLPKPASGNTSEPVEFCFQNK